MERNYDYNNKTLKKEKITIDFNNSKIYDEIAFNLAGQIKNITNSQMRKIFNQIKDYKMRLNSGDKWETIYPLFQLTKAHVYYTIKRNNPKNLKEEWEIFENIFNQCYSHVKTKDDFLKIATFFEALYAYYYYLSESTNN